MTAVEPPAHLSPQARQFLLSPEEPPPDLDVNDPELMAAVREMLEAQWAELESRLTGPWASRSETIAGVPVIRYGADPESLDRAPVIVHLHGGAYIVGSPTASATMAVPVAQRTGLPVVSVGYRLAPEHPCPAAVDDAAAVCRALAAEGSVAAMYGESAGGGLTLATAVALRDAGAAVPARLGLVAPWADLTCSGDTYRTLAAVDPILGALEPASWAAAYAGADTSDPRASPLSADLSGLPPCLIQVSTRDILLSDACRLDAALRRAGTASTLQVWDGLWHVWHSVPDVPEAQAAMDDLADFLVG